MRTALEAGLGFAILARSTVGNDLLENRVHARRIVEPTLTRDLHLIMLAEHPQTRAFMEVRQLVKQTLVDEVKSGRWRADLLDKQKTARRKMTAMLLSAWSRRFATPQLANG